MLNTVPGIPLYKVMIAVQKPEPLLFVVVGQEPERIVMDRLYLFHRPVLPQFITVSKLYIRELPVIIISECRKVESLILQKIIIRRSCTPVAVAEQYIPGIGAKGQDRGIRKCGIQPVCRTHDCFLRLGFLRE